MRRASASFDLGAAPTLSGLRENEVYALTHLCRFKLIVLKILALDIRRSAIRKLRLRFQRLFLKDMKRQLERFVCASIYAHLQVAADISCGAFSSE